MEMQKFRASSVFGKARKMAGKVQASFAAVVALVAASVLVPLTAFAATDPGAAITAEITSAKTTITGILVVLAGIVGLFILWAYLKRAK